jgi:hypothetical protein
MGTTIGLVELENTHTHTHAMLLVSERKTLPEKRTNKKIDIYFKLGRYKSLNQKHTRQVTYARSVQNKY